LWIAQVCGCEFVSCETLKVEGSQQGLESHCDLQLKGGKNWETRIKKEFEKPSKHNND